VEKATFDHVLRTNTREQKARFGRKLKLSESRRAVSDAAHQILLSSGYYHIVKYEVLPRYLGNERVHPASLEYRGTCQTCSATVFATTTILNSIRPRR
jgi:hypothetical protein